MTMAWCRTTCNLWPMSPAQATEVVAEIFKVVKISKKRVEFGPVGGSSTDERTRWWVNAQLSTY